MAPSLSKPSSSSSSSSSSLSSSSFNISPFALSNSTLRVDCHHNISITPYSYTPTTQPCFIAFNATSPNSFNTFTLDREAAREVSPTWEPLTSSTLLALHVMDKFGWSTRHEFDPPGFVLQEKGLQYMGRVRMLVKALKEEFSSLEYVCVCDACRRVGVKCVFQKLHSHLEGDGIHGVKVLLVPVAESEENGGRVKVERVLSASVKEHFKGNGVIPSAKYCDNNSLLLGTQVTSLACVGMYVITTLSGGLIYVADTGGNHNFELLKTLVLPDGSILRCEDYALPTRDYLFADPIHDGKTMLKIWNLNKYNGVLGVFNCQGPDCLNNAELSQSISTKVNPKDIEWDSGKNPISIEGVELFALYFSQAKKLILSASSDSEEISLEPFSFELITVSPVTVLSGKSVKFAPIGLVNMLNTGGAVQSLTFHEAHNLVEVGVRGSGEMMVYASQKPRACKIDGKEFDFDYEGSMVKILIPWPGSSRLSTVQYVF